MGDAAIPFVLGRREWVALPELGIPAIKVKVDTGARTSALHARAIEAYKSEGGPMVRFTVHPVMERPEIEIACSAAIIDRREVTSTSGETESRFIIRSPIRVDGYAWPIEIGLTNRAGLNYRMLLGRQAIQPGMLVDPASSFLHPKLSAAVYGR